MGSEARYTAIHVLSLETLLYVLANHAFHILTIAFHLPRRHNHVQTVRIICIYELFSFLISSHPPTALSGLKFCFISFRL